MKRIIKLTEAQFDKIIERKIVALKSVINEEITDAVLLRKMALKSKFTYGKHIGQTVEEVLRLNYKSYIRNSYYNIEGISFTDDILKIVGIYGNTFDYRIKKPGKKPELGKEINNSLAKHANLGQRAHFKRKLKAKAVGRSIADRKAFSKGNLQSQNQGHR